MNENVKTKTPKRRRWIARLLVSALCILLASSLLFVGVVAENIELVAQFSGNYGLATTPYNNFVYSFGPNFLVYSNSYMVYLQQGSTVKSAFDLRSSDGYSSAYISDSISFYFDGVYLYGFSTKKASSSLRVSFYTFSIADNEIVSASVINTSVSVSGSHFSAFTPFVVVDGIVYSFYFYKESSTTTILNLSFLKLSGVDLSYFGYGILDTGLISYYSSVSFQNGNCILGIYGYSKVFLFNIYSSSFSTVSLSSYASDSQNFVFDYDGDTYLVNSVCFLKWNNDTVSFEKVGIGVPGYYFSAYNGVLTSYSLPASMSIPYTVYTGLPTTEPPPETSDDTTETPPPESSDETSTPGDIPEGYTKIWYSTLGSDGAYSATVIGAIDLREAVEVRAYLGSWTSIDASFQSDIQVPLTIQVFNSDEGPPVVYTYDYYAAGYAVDSGIPDDFVFPDFIGDYVTLPYNGELNIYFADVSPSGTVLVSTPATWGGRVTLNLTSASSYFRLDFIDEDTFAVVVFNGDGPGSRVNFNFDIRAYREYYVASDGDKTTSRWFTPSFGTSVSYSSERVLNDGLYMVFVDSYNDTDYPWENGDWSSAIDDMNSRLDEISYDHALLESLANDAYGDFPFGSADKADFDAAISNFDTIKDSSGGDYILRYISGLWTIHPFASSMVIIVGTFAIIGFIIRKL